MITDSTTNSTNATATVHRIGLTVADTDQALQFFADLIGPASVDTEASTVCFEPGIEVIMEPAVPAYDGPPRVVDIGTNHLCLRVADIEAAVAHLDAMPDIDVLGDVITVPDGPIAGNRWIYFRSPWGTLFELQQWPELPAYAAGTAERLFHSHRAPTDAKLPSVLGLDHTGYSVSSLADAVSYLVDVHGARVVLRTEITADRHFMNSQFGLDIAGSSQMAMLVADGLNIELFEHRVGHQAPPRTPDQLGGNYLALATTTAAGAIATRRARFGLHVEPVTSA